MGMGVYDTVVSELMKVPDSVYERARQLSDERDMSYKEAVRLMCREGGFDV